MNIRNIIQKTTLLLFVLLCMEQINAQQFYSISAGANYGQVTTKINGKKDEAIKPALGYIIKANAYFAINKSLFIMSGLQYETIRNQVNTESTSTLGATTTQKKFTGKAWFGFVNIPAQLTYMLPAAKGRLYIGAGPYIFIGITGRTKSTELTTTTVGGNTTVNEFNYKGKVKFGNAVTSLQRVNAGLGLQVSYATEKRMMFCLYANKGLNNLNKQTGYNTKTWSSGVTVGYLIKKKS